MSSLLQGKQAIQNWVESGTADYQGVGRLMLQALGGGGALQYLDWFNHATGADNQEARIVGRINANNYLRVAGRETGLDVRVSQGGETLSTPMRPLLGRMVLAAYANDAADFADAYRQARQLAITQREPDPDKYIQQKFAGYNPLRSVFRTEPSETEYARLLAALPDEGRMAVSNAMRLFNGYLEQIGGRADFGRRERAVTQELTRSVVDLETVRRMVVGF